MDLDKLLESWVKVLFERLSIISLNEGAEQEAHEAALQILTAVYAVGHEAGMEKEKLQHQLEKLGRPHGNTN